MATVPVNADLAVDGVVKVKQATLDAAALTTNRTLALPDKSGTLATTDDVGGGVDEFLSWLGW